MIIPRVLDLKALLSRKSHFLFGPRGTGKSKLIEICLPNSNTQVFDLLSDDVFSRLLRRPSLLPELIEPDTTQVVIDEIQKIPALLDEVHRLIEKKKVRFLLTGSSARKLRHGGANLLGGRAWETHLFPLTSMELGPRFDLNKYLNCGGLPAVYFSNNPREELQNYVKLYVKEEINAESLVRRLDNFVRFLDVAALANSEELNFEGIANDSGVPARTVASYIELLEDTLIGFQIPPFAKTRKRKAIKRSKFFFFDVGVAGALARRGKIEEKSELFGRALEHFIAQELRAFIGYNNLEIPLCYWRSTSQYEVDFVLGEQLSIEVKATERVSERDLCGLKALQEEKMVRKSMLVSMDPLRRTVGDIEIVPVKNFLSELWAGKVI